jgi:hypothetical protein
MQGGRGKIAAHATDAEGREHDFAFDSEGTYFFEADWVYPINVNVSDPDTEGYWLVLELADKEPIEYAVGGDAGEYS